MVTQNHFVRLCHCWQDTDRMTIMIGGHCNRSRLQFKKCSTSTAAVIEKFHPPPQECETARSAPASLGLRPGNGKPAPDACVRACSDTIWGRFRDGRG